MNCAARSSRSLWFRLLFITLLALVTAVPQMPALIPRLLAQTSQGAAIGSRVWLNANGSLFSRQ